MHRLISLMPLFVILNLFAFHLCRCGIHLYRELEYNPSVLGSLNSIFNVLV